MKALDGELKPKLVAHISLDHNFILKDATFKVSDSGRERCRAECQKNVHAMVQGIYSEVLWKDLPNLDSNTEEVTYNPYFYETFVKVDSLKPVYKSEDCRFMNGKILILRV